MGVRKIKDFYERERIWYRSVNLRGRSDETKHSKSKGMAKLCAQVMDIRRGEK